MPSDMVISSLSPCFFYSQPLQIQHLLNYGGGMSARTTAAVEVTDFFAK